MCPSKENVRGTERRNMANYYPPEGFTLDTASGEYKNVIVIPDENGINKQVITWFNDVTGEYRQEIRQLTTAAPPMQPAPPAPPMQPAPPAPPMQPAPPAPPANAGQPAPMTIPMPPRTEVNAAPPAYTGPYYQPPRKKSKVPAIIGIIAAVLVLGAGVVFGGKYLLDKRAEGGDGKFSFAAKESKDSDDAGESKAGAKIVDKTVDGGGKSASADSGSNGSVDTDDGDDTTDSGANSYYTPEESYSTAVFLLSYHSSTNLIYSGDPVDLSKFGGMRTTTDYRPYAYSFEFDSQGNVEYWFCSYVSAEDAANYSYDNEIIQSDSKGIETIDKWMEGESTACVKFSYSGYTATLKCDFENKTEKLFLDDVSSSADPKCLLAYCDDGIGELYTPEDIEEIKDKLGMDW